MAQWPQRPALFIAVGFIFFSVCISTTVSATAQAYGHRSTSSTPRTSAAQATKPRSSQQLSSRLKAQARFKEETSAEDPSLAAVLTLRNEERQLPVRQSVPLAFGVLLLLVGALYKRHTAHSSAAKGHLQRRLDLPAGSGLQQHHALPEGGLENDGQQAGGAGSVIQEFYEALVASIIRPPRAEYTAQDLGPAVFTVRGERYCRTDYEVYNGRGHVLQCSEWAAEVLPSASPYVIYLHGNASCRAEALDLLAYCLPCGLSVVSFDFAGCGQSTGDYISLGHFECEDLAAVVDDLRIRRHATGLVIWGRSMGAVTALLYTAGVAPKSSPFSTSATVDGLVVDSAFTSLEALSRGLAQRGDVLPFPLPRILVSAALWLIGRSVQRRAGFDIWSLAPIATVPSTRVPALFAHAEGDKLIPFDHSRLLLESYGGPKQLIALPGDHNSSRPSEFLAAAARFAQAAARGIPNPLDSPALATERSKDPSEKVPVPSL